MADQIADQIKEKQRTLLSIAPFGALDDPPPIIDETALAEIEKRLLNRRKFEAEDGRIAAALAFRSNPSKQLLAFAAEHADYMLANELRSQKHFTWLEPERQVQRPLMEHRSGISREQWERPTLDGFSLRAS